MIDARQIEVSLGRRRVLNRVDFQARAGELTAIVGPNGSGKTTLIRALTSEIGFTGQLRINDRDPGQLKPWVLAQLRGVLAQSAQLAFPFTVFEVVRLGAEAGGHAGPEATALAQAALARVDLAGYEGRRYQALSGGEQQRVQLARVLCQVWDAVTPEGPRWLFLDEPVSALDIGHQLQVMRLARDYARQGGGVVAVMHDLNLTAMFADRIVLMEAGEIAATGPVTEVLRADILSRVYGCRLNVMGAGGDAGLLVVPAAEPV
ncbi:heme ABC transporter ATP-binding protein [Pseudodonghicola flavimaris]|uniref:Heme ABC transporter ATP-binding protein n=1 Tax=Pseudodonghicola flavimaris TaxID=3050036 RepID=A0ABT7EYI1_9RHOB|nr:heme ABC transporter ATP-binding protein [Pseudodonghicola flavimaris]MDK3017330.1 heme ABC transporter ATP-binding protein [Pseudodonghicola flavimaris]